MVTIYFFHLFIYCNTYAGFRFWKVNSRKFYAVPADDLITLVRKRKRLRHQRSWSPSPLHSGCGCGDVLEEMKAEMKEDMEQLKGKCGKIFQLTADLKIPLGLMQLLLDSLKCRICHQSPMEPPIVMGKCCKSIIGCEACTNQWYSGDEALTKSCPNCRAARGYAETVRLHGIDDVLVGLLELVDEDEVTQ